MHTVGFMKRVCSVYTFFTLSINYPSARNQRSERFSGNQLYQISGLDKTKLGSGQVVTQALPPVVDMSANNRYLY